MFPTVSDEKGSYMSPRHSNAAAIPGETHSRAWHEDLSRIGLHFSGNGSILTATPLAVPFLFGRPALYEFALTLTATALLRLRHLLTFGEGQQHLPVSGHILAHDHTLRPTTRLIATAQRSPFSRLRLEITTWCNDSTEAWLETHLLENLTSADIDHFHVVRAMWAAGIHPLSEASRYVAAGFNPREARELQDTVAPADRNAQIDLLIALRAG